MKTHRLGNSDMNITAIGLGTYAIGGADWKFGWGPQDDQASIAALRRGIEGGINWIDTAPVYGLGHAEEIVAQAITGLASRPYVFTKCSMVWDSTGQIITNVLKRESIRREVEDSLRRLRVETIDLMQIHWPRAQADIEEAWETLAQLREQGKIRYIGVSNFDADQMERVRRIADITSLQPPYSMLNRAIETDILPYAAKHGIGVLAYAPMQSGLLSGKMTRSRIEGLPANDWRRGSTFFQEPMLSRNLAVAEVLAAVARELPRAAGRAPTVPEVAIAWVLQRPGVTAAIVGARRPEHVEDFLHADAVVLDAAALARIDAALTAASPGA